MREYKGVAVPWVALWSAELVSPEEHPLWVNNGRVAFRDEAKGDRDSQGVLWVRNILAPGQGTPLFAQVQADRQRNCMVTPRCQVCGLRMPSHKFLLQEPMIYRFEKQGYISTTTPPTCDFCIDVAATLCPQLARKPLIRVVPTSIGMWGYAGDVVEIDGSWTKNVMVSVSDPRLPRLLAKQIAVAITEWTEEPWEPTSPTMASTPS